MYNRPRRGGYGSPASNVSNVGRRRPQPQSNNFVPGGQLNPKQDPASPYKRKQETQEQKPIFTPPAPAPINNPLKPEPIPEVNLQKTADAILSKQSKVEPTTPAPEEQTKMEQSPAVAATGKEEDSQMDTSQDEATPAKQPKMWHKRTKVPKAEKQRQNNIRLRKMLQPKGAPMLLPEIFGKLKYNVEPANREHQLFKAVLNVHGLAHEGLGSSSKEAETAAAEAALKHVALSKLKAEKAAILKAQASEAEPSAEKMEQGEEDVSIVNTEPEYNKSFSFEHLASFAMYKLLSSWDNEGKPDDGSYLNLMSNANYDGNLSENKKLHEFRASKKMPANPELMNPVMLLNQMHPEAVYDMICVTGSTNKVSFTMKCMLGTKVFVGTGSSKKTAKKKAAYEACKDILGIVYPEENSELNESTTSMEDEKVVEEK